VKTTNEEEGDHMEEVQKSLKHRNKRERGERKRYAELKNKYLTTSKNRGCGNIFPKFIKI